MIPAEVNNERVRRFREKKRKVDRAIEVIKSMREKRLLKYYYEFKDSMR